MPDANPDRINEIAPDGGPYYVETPADLALFNGIAEPFNTVTASFFMLIVFYWVWRLRGQYRQYPFLTACLPILFVGGLGGTLYHGSRTLRIYFLMDVVPIFLLTVAIALYFWIRLGPKLRHVFGFLAFWALLQLLGRWQLPRAWAITLSYSMLAVLILTPLAVVIIRTKGVAVGWLLTAVLSFGVALFCRIADTIRPPLLPMGTHWLWHSFGALTTALLAEYLYRVAQLNLKPVRPDAPPTLP